MKDLLKLIACFLITGIASILSCKKEYSCEDCITNNPPLANAGPDQKITLPQDSVVVDGSTSVDPDGTIAFFTWAKISGPVSSNVISTGSSKTLIKALVIGVYKFELTISDNGGLTAKDTVQIIVIDPAHNQPPIANAGIDQTIILPIDTTSLNGNLSVDPDGVIRSYEWIKISGPSSFTILNTNSVQTKVNGLVQGVYLFELKVVDDGGLTGKDTMQILVNSSGGPVNNSVNGCNVTMTPFGRLSQAGAGRIVSAGTKIFFSGYLYNGLNNNVTNIYDTITHSWSTSNLYFGDINVGNKLISVTYTYPVNQEVFEVYDAVTGARSTHITPEARYYLNHTLVGNKVVFSEGSNPDSSYTVVSKRLDIYDAGSNSWSLVNFKEARFGMGSIGFGNKIFFAGGTQVRYDSLVQSCDDSGLNCIMVPAVLPMSRVDIYDVSTNTWSIAHLSEPRTGITTAVVGNKILFAGGGSSTRVDIYDVSNNNWSTAQLSHYIYDQSGRKRAHVVGNKVLFTRLGSKMVDIYDSGNNTWSTAQMSEINNQTDYLVAGIGNKLMFFTVFDVEHISKNIDIYDAATNTWCHTVLDRSLIRSGIISTGKSIYIAGGISKSNPNGTFDEDIDDIWILKF